MDIEKKISRGRQSRSQTATSSQVARMVLGAFILLMMLSQLFAFEKFPQVIGGIGFATVWASVCAIALVIIELMSLPFLLSVEVSRNVQRISKICVFIALVGLTILEVIAFGAGQSILFGALFDLPGGTWSLLLLTALWVLAAWGVITRSTSTPARAV